MHGTGRARVREVILRSYFVRSAGRPPEGHEIGVLAGEQVLHVAFDVVTLRAINPNGVRLREHFSHKHQQTASSFLDVFFIIIVH